jgi:hypothetical protein
MKYRLLSLLLLACNAGRNGALASSDQQIEIGTLGDLPSITARLSPSPPPSPVLPDVFKSSIWSAPYITDSDPVWDDGAHTGGWLPSLCFASSSCSSLLLLLLAINLSG